MHIQVTKDHYYKHLKIIINKLNSIKKIENLLGAYKNILNLPDGSRGAPIANIYSVL